MPTHSGTPSYGVQGSVQLGDLNSLPAQLQLLSLHRTQLVTHPTPALTSGLKLPQHRQVAGTPGVLRALRSRRAVWCKEVSLSVLLSGSFTSNGPLKKPRRLLVGSLVATAIAGQDTRSRPASLRLTAQMASSVPGINSCRISSAASEIPSFMYETILLLSRGM